MANRPQTNQPQPGDDRSGIAISVLIFLITVSLIVAYGAQCTATVLDRFPDAIHPRIQMLLAFNMLVVVLGPFILVGLVAARASARAGLSPEEPGSEPADDVTGGPTEDAATATQSETAPLTTARLL